MMAQPRGTPFHEKVWADDNSLRAAQAKLIMREAALKMHGALGSSFGFMSAPLERTAPKTYTRANKMSHYYLPLVPQFFHGPEPFKTKCSKSKTTLLSLLARRRNHSVVSEKPERHGPPSTGLNNG